MTDAKPPKPQFVMCPCCETKINVNGSTKPRSPEQNRRFWALMKATWLHWPETHSEQFSDMNSLRHWLTMKAGWREEAARIPIVGVKLDYAQMLVKAAFASVGTSAWPIVHKTSVVIFRPASIAFAKMKPAEFNLLNDTVAKVIEAETTMTADELLRETEKAA